uniref:MICOS complex subunit MIC13 n=1 Tax=Meloidogyne javanica TaxID=6303 RepID=A0A915LM97_MELJA
MCISRIGQIIYGGLSGITIALICASMFTPGWRRLTLHVNDSFDSLKKGNPSAMQNITNMNFGIFLCQIPNPQQQLAPPNSLPLSDNNSPKEENEDSWKKSLNYCEQWFKLPQIKIKVNDLDIDSLKSSAVDLVKFVNNLDEKTTKEGNEDNQGNVD